MTVPLRGGSRAPRSVRHGVPRAILALLLGTTLATRPVAAEPAAGTERVTVLVGRLGRACVGEVCLDGGGDAGPGQLDVVAVLPDDRVVVRHYGNVPGSLHGASLLELTLDPVDLVPRTTEAISWSPPGAEGASVLLHAGVPVVPIEGSDDRVLWYDTFLCGEVPGPVSTTRVGTPIPLPPHERSTDTAVDDRFVLHSTPGGDVIARGSCPTDSTLIAGAFRELRWAVDHTVGPAVREIEVRGDHVLVEFQGRVVTVRGWVDGAFYRAWRWERYATIRERAPLNPYGELPPRPPVPWPLGTLPRGAALYDRPHGGRVGAVLIDRDGVPVCPAGSLVEVAWETRWGEVTLFAAAEDVVPAPPPVASLRRAVRRGEALVEEALVESARRCRP